MKIGGIDTIPLSMTSEEKPYKASFDSAAVVQNVGHLAPMATPTSRYFTPYVGMGSIFRLLRSKKKH